MLKNIAKGALYSICSAIVLALPSAALAQAGGNLSKSTSVDELVRQLDRPSPSSRTRGFMLAEPPAELVSACEETISELRTRSFRSRGFTLQDPADRQSLSECEQTRGQADVEIFFERNSSKLSQAGMASLKVLGQALSMGNLRDKTFVIAGHTDARGTAEYNQALSERRAETVRDVLVAVYGIDRATLIVAGFGFEKLKNPQNPLADANRRVQIINLGR